MLSFIFRRILYSIPLLFVISIIIFFIIELPPGDYATWYVSQTKALANITQEQALELTIMLREKYGLNEPLVIRYFNCIKNIVFNFDFGFSMHYNKPVSEMLGDRLPRTLAIALICHFFATTIGVFIGIYAAKNQNKLGDNVATIFAFLGMTIPRFFLALLIMYWLAIVLNSDNTGSMYSPYYAVQPMSFAKLWNGILHIWPIFVIAIIGGLAYNMRVMRGNLLDVMRMQYIETARAKGLSENQTLYRHAVPNALHPLVMFQGIALPYMLMGELEAAIVLSIPTAGPLLVESIQRQDTYTTAAILFCLTVILIIGNIIADILLAILDPRVRQN